MMIESKCDIIISLRKKETKLRRTDATQKMEARRDKKTFNCSLLGFSMNHARKPVSWSIAVWGIALDNDSNASKPGKLSRKA